MNPCIIINTVRAYLAAQLDCTPEGLSGSGVLYVPNRTAQPPFLKLAVIGGGRVVVSSSPELLPQVKALTQGRTRDELFELPLVYGQTIHFIPDQVSDMPLSAGYEYHLLEGAALGQLAGLSAFPNSLAFDEDGHTGTGMVCFAQFQDQMIALAGAGEQSQSLQEMGVDTSPSHRGRGLVSWLARELLARERVPFYSASVNNIGSQAVAHRSGLRPCWMDTYSNVLREDYIYKKCIKRVF